MTEDKLNPGCPARRTETQKPKLKRIGVQRLRKSGFLSRYAIGGYNVEFQGARPAKAGEDY